MQKFVFRSIQQVLIRNLPQTVKPHRLLQEFSKVGVIKEFKFPLDENDYPVGYILIEYSNPKHCALAASKFDNTRFEENYLKATVLKEDPSGATIGDQKFLPRSDYEENQTEQIRLT